MKNNQPTAQVAVNKSVLKLYNGKVYLQDNQEFGIELFNPTNNSIAAEVWLNDKKSFNSLLVLRPGQRMFLECNPETKRKFKFETYKVEDGNEQVKVAIKNNGKVEVKFFNEKIIPIVIYPIVSEVAVFDPILCDLAPYNPMYGQSVNSLRRRFSKTSMPNLNDQTKEVETGRIEAGSTSGQKFETVNMEFDHYAFHSTSIQILPHSQKPIEDASPRTYCIQCGIRNRDWKFCPKCGSKF